MNDRNESQLPDLTGGCLCGGVKYRIRGPRRHIIDCHCENCRRTHGHFAAYTAVNKASLALLSEQSLKWYHDSSPDIYRGFCDNCGASLFWDARKSDNKISISAGSLDPGNGLKTVGHVFVAESGEYYEIEDDLPQFSHSSENKLDTFFIGSSKNE
ncbi:MAG: GFA family protein [Gammaproteobacteria bacterium]|nr:GFA family protein [Gammaproteobacteria bacterium]